MTIQKFRPLKVLYGQGEAMDFKSIADKCELAHGTTLSILIDHERAGVVQELEYAEGVYALTPQGIAEIEAMR